MKLTSFFTGKWPEMCPCFKNVFPDKHICLEKRGDAYREKLCVILN